MNADDLLKITTRCLTDGPHTEMLRNRARRRRQTANKRDIRAWADIHDRTAWEAFLTPRIEALRASLGSFPKPPEDLHIQKTGENVYDGYAIENLIFESRPGIFVTANLYRPDPIRDAMPGMLLVHSHHNPRVQGELQDMGAIWARSGCLVLVIDQFAYGERGQHQPGPRQDYRFRYVTAAQLHAMGDSLMGWMVWDIHRGVDLLLARECIDSEKIIVLGSVAGGGDPAAVAAALDERIACAVPFNFGGPQPESAYPLPDDAAQSFDYMGGGSWESTRNLRLSGRDGFLPWVIVGSIAPRRLIYAHEFAWDRERDPVWERLQKIYAWYDASDRLDHTQGFGKLTGRPPHASHCNNIGPPHRIRIYAALNRWFGIPILEEDAEYRHPETALKCLTPDVEKTLKIPPVHEVFEKIGAQRLLVMRQAVDAIPPAQRRERLCRAWKSNLGDIDPRPPVIRSDISHRVQRTTINRVVIETDHDVAIPLLILQPDTCQSAVIGVSQAGKTAFLQANAQVITELLHRGIAIVLPDVRGTGETQPEGERHPRSAASGLSATEWMLGETLLGARLRDLRTVLVHLRNRLPNRPMALWGDSAAPTNPADLKDALMEDAAVPPHSEPLGGLLALFCALFENDIRAVLARKMISGFQALLSNTYCYIPHDVIIPGALPTGDLCDMASAIAPMPLRLENLVDGRNCPVGMSQLKNAYRTASHAYAAAPDNLALEPDDDLIDWFARTLT